MTPEQVDELNDKYCPLSPEEKAECKHLAEKHYWRFNSIKFKPDGLVIVSEDQGGWPFDAVTIKAATEPERVAKACMAFMRALAGED